MFPRIRTLDWTGRPAGSIHRDNVGAELAVGRFGNASDALAAGLSLLEQKQQVASLLQIASMAKTLATSFDFPIDLSVTDISELCFIILMEAARSAQEDLREAMATVQAINDAKSETRATMARVSGDIAANADQHGGKPPLQFSRDGLGSAKAYRRLFLVQPDPTSLGGVRRVPADPNHRSDLWLPRPAGRGVRRVDHDRSFRGVRSSLGKPQRCAEGGLSLRRTRP